MFDSLIPLAAVHPIVHVNALLNALATVLLLAGYTAIRLSRRLPDRTARSQRERTHMRLMLTAFGVSIAFLACYVYYHLHVGSVAFTGQGLVRPVYFTILITHVVLAALVPPLAAVTIYFGWRDWRPAHRRIARWTFPIWLYVSVTGVVVYVMLYHLYPTPP